MQIRDEGRATRDGGRIGWLFAVALTLASVLAGCAGYGGETIEAGGGRIETDGEHCALTLPEGWTWRPASWVAVSPLETRMAFEEQLYGRPQYSDWEEVKARKIADGERSGAQVTADDDTVRIDYGPNAGLTVLQRFDRVGCQVTFSNARATRAVEFPVWEQIIESLERTSPTPNFTPPAGAEEAGSGFGVVGEDRRVSQRTADRRSW